MAANRLPIQPFRLGSRPRLVRSPDVGDKTMSNHALATRAAPALTACRPPPIAGHRQRRRRRDRACAAPQLAALQRLRPGAHRPHARCAARVGSATGARDRPPARARLARPPGDGVRLRADVRHRQHGHPRRRARHAAAVSRRRQLPGPRRTRGAASWRQLARTMARHQRHRHGHRRRRAGGGARRRALPGTQRLPDLHGRTDHRPHRPGARGAGHLGRPPRLPPPHTGAGEESPYA